MNSKMNKCRVVRRDDDVAARCSFIMSNDLLATQWRTHKKYVTADEQDDSRQSNQSSIGNLKDEESAQKPKFKDKALEMFNSSFFFPYS